MQRVIYSPNQQAETGNYTVHLLLCITMKLKYLENLASLRCYNYAGSCNCELRRWTLFLLGRKILLHKKLLVASSWPFKISIKNMHFVTFGQMARVLRLLLFSRSSRERAEECPPCKPRAVTSMGEVQSTIYSGATIQIFVGCSAMIKQRGFQRMRSMCDFPSSTISTLYLQYQVTARSKIIVVWGRWVQNLSSFSKWKSFMELQSIIGMWGITQGPDGDWSFLPQVFISAVQDFSCENKWYKLVIKCNLCAFLLSPWASCTIRVWGAVCNPVQSVTIAFIINYCFCLKFILNMKHHKHMTVKVAVTWGNAFVITNNRSNADTSASEILSIWKSA